MSNSNPPPINKFYAILVNGCIESVEADARDIEAKMATVHRSYHGGPFNSQAECDAHIAKDSTGQVDSF